MKIKFNVKQKEYLKKVVARKGCYTQCYINSDCGSDYGCK